MARKRTDVEASARERGERPDEVLDRNVDELLQETRVATAGVQFLFAFLLTLPFTQRFESLTAFHRDVYTITLLSTACAAIVLIAPVSFHRVLFRQHEKAAVVTFADRALLVGLVLLLIGIASAVLLVLDVVLGRRAAVTGCAAVTLLAAGVWFAVPGIRRARSSDRTGLPADPAGNRRGMTENAPQRASDDQTDDAGAGRTPHPGQPAEGGVTGEGEGTGRTPHPEQPAEGTDPAAETPGIDPDSRVTGV